MANEGVWFDQTTRKWRAQLVEDGEIMRLGMVETREEAERKFKQAWAKVREDRPVPDVVPTVGAGSTSPTPAAAAAATPSNTSPVSSQQAKTTPVSSQQAKTTPVSSAGPVQTHPSAVSVNQSLSNAPAYSASQTKPASVANSSSASSGSTQKPTSSPPSRDQKAAMMNPAIMSKSSSSEARHSTSSDVLAKSLSEPIIKATNFTASKPAVPLAGAAPTSAAIVNQQQLKSAAVESKLLLQPQQQAAAMTSKPSSSSNATSGSIANPALASNVPFATNVSSTASSSNAAAATLPASTANFRASLPLVGGECKCGSAVCNLNSNKRTEIWQHSRVCKRPKVCGIGMCERLQQAGTDDIQEAWAKLERDVHPAPTYTPRVRPTRRDTHFPKLEGEFTKTDIDFFGTDHLNPNANVLMTGMYNPLTKTMSGKWTVIQKQPLENPAELPPHNAFTFACSTDNIIDPNHSQVCPVCLSSEETLENSFVVCDLCDRPYHLFCIGLMELPKEDFYCSKCAELLDKYGVEIPPTRMWKGRFEIYDTKKKGMKTVPDDVYFEFDYSRANASSMAVITGKGKNEFGSFTVKGVLKRMGSSYPFQFAKTFDIANHSAA